MNHNLEIINQKLDKILIQQDQILNKLNNLPINYNLPKHKSENTFKKLDPNISREQLYYEVLKNRNSIKEKFNLMQAPQFEKIVTYLKNGDPKIFDGLKRKIPSK